MRYVAAFMLAALGSKGSPTEADVTKILSSVGIEADSERVKKVVSELKGKDLNQLIEQGSKKLAAVPSGGGVAAPSAKVGSAPAASPAAAAAPPPAAKKEEKKESEESDEDMGFGLFD